jgi:3-oxoacyl-[acyl-carrier protein] reductase
MTAGHDTDRQPAAPPDHLAGKVVLITGGSDGIGAATARRFAAAGAKVAVNYHSDRGKAEALVRDLTDAGAHAVAAPGDVTDEEQTAAAVAQTAADLGPIDVLVACASGLYLSDVPVAPFEQTGWQATERTVLRRLRSLVFPLQAVLPSMYARGAGSIVVVGSSLSRVPAAGMVPISMAHAAADAGVRALAREAGKRGVRVNAVAPNLILTPANKGMPEEFKAMVAERSAVGRNGLAEDVAEAIAFLAGDAASYLTGTYLVADGGTAML